MKKVLLSLATVALAVAANAQSKVAQNLPTASKKGFEFKFHGYASSNCLSGEDKTLPLDSVTKVNSVWMDLYGFAKKGITTGFLISKDTISNKVTLKFDGTQGYTDKKDPKAYNSLDALFTLRFPLNDCGYGSKEISLADEATRNIQIEIDNASDTARFAVIALVGDSAYMFDQTPAGIKYYADDAASRATFRLPKGKSVIYGKLTDIGWNGKTNSALDLASVAGLGFIVDQNKAVDITITNIKVGDAAPATAPKGSLRTIQARGGFTGLSNDAVANISLTVAPNPASETATLSYASQAGKSVSVVLSNGVSTVATIAGGESSTEINVAGLAAGLYYASVYVDGAYASTSKVLVK